MFEQSTYFCSLRGFPAVRARVTPKPDVIIRHAGEKLYLDFSPNMSLHSSMILDDDEIRELPRRLFAMAGRKLENAVTAASTGEARNLAPQFQLDLAGKLHGCGQDMMVIADAIVALTDEAAS